MKKRFLKFISVPFVVLFAGPIILILGIKWALKGNKTIYNYFDDYINWLYTKKFDMEAAFLKLNGKDFKDWYTKLDGKDKEKYEKTIKKLRISYEQNKSMG